MLSKNNGSSKHHSILNRPILICISTSMFCGTIGHLHAKHGSTSKYFYNILCPSRSSICTLTTYWEASKSVKCPCQVPQESADFHSRLPLKSN